VSQFALRISDSMNGYAKEMAQADHTSLNQFIVAAVAEKISALNTEEFFRQRAKQVNLVEFDQILAKIPARTPFLGDEL
jgi:uncharacterized protein (DUF1778 family)